MRTFVANKPIQLTEKITGNMNPKTIEKLLKLPNGEDGNDFNWVLYDKNGKLTLDYKSVFNEDDFETLISVVKDTSIWVDNENYLARIQETGISELQHVHCFRTLALYKKEEVIDLFLAIFDLDARSFGSDLHFENFSIIFMLFSNNQKVMQRLFDLFSIPLTTQNNLLQGAITEFLAELYGVVNLENQEIIEKIWIDKLQEKTSKNNDFYDKEILNSLIISGLLRGNLVDKHRELIEKLSNTEVSTIGTQNFNAQHTRKLIPKSDQKKNKNKKKAAKASKKKNRK